MQNNQNYQYGQASEQQGGYYFQPQPQQNQYVQPQIYPNQQSQPYLDPNIPVGQPAYQPQYGNYPQGPTYIQPGVVPSNIVEIFYFYNTGRPVLRNADGIKFPVEISCPYCNQQGVTRIEHRVGDGTICASILVLIFCWPLFWIPCCLQDCQDRVHICNHCQKCVGKKKYKLCS